jgi:hypothetical protein
MRGRLRAALFVWALLACLVIPSWRASGDVSISPAALPGLRIGVVERGMHRLTYEALLSAGVPVDQLDPALLALWWRDQPIALDLLAREAGVFGPGDAFVFYGEPYVGRYMTQNLYRLTWSGPPGARIRARDAAPARSGLTATIVTQSARVERNRVYYSAFKDLPRDADHLFDLPLYANAVVPTAAVTYTLALPNLVPAGAAELRVAVHGGLLVKERDPDHSLALRVNRTSLGAYTWDGSVARIVTARAPAALLSEESQVVLEASLSQLPGIDAYAVLPDWVEVTYPAKARAVHDRLYVEGVVDPWLRVYLPLLSTEGPPWGQSGLITAIDGYDVLIEGFGTDGIRAYDVTDPRDPVRLDGLTQLVSSGSRAILFAAQPATAYAVASDAGFLLPASVEYDAGLALRSGRHADYIAIVHRSLWDAVQPLLDHRAAEGLAVVKVDPQDIYDEFSGGMVDPEAIRAFLGFAYRNWNAGGRPPEYVLLVGDGHYDFKGELRPGAPNLIPPYLLSVDPHIGETATDNRYASVDGDDDFLPDMALGRIPARTAAEVTAVVDKIIAYERSAPPGEWQRRAVFVADPQNDSAGNFHLLSDQVRAMLPSAYASDTIYYKASVALDAPGEMKASVRAAFENGALYLQWFGHAARASWSNDRVWEVNDPAKLTPNNVWPFTAHYSCWSGYFINVLPSAQYGNSDQSLGEALLLAPKRGSLADFSPSGLHVGPALKGLNQALIRAIFVDRIDRIGKATDAARKAYHASNAGPPDIIDTQVLLGDPATRLKLP